MTKANELRLGNWISEEVLGICPVVGIEENSVWLGAKHMNVDRSVIIQNYRISESNLLPIPLTPEILDRCGFEKGNYHTNWFSHLNLAPHIVKYGDGFILEMVDDIRVSDSFEHLHQLQNLYFALTGEELPISEQAPEECDATKAQ